MLSSLIEEGEVGLYLQGYRTGTRTATMILFENKSVIGKFENETSGDDLDNDYLPNFIKRSYTNASGKNIMRNSHTSQQSKLGSPAMS